MALNLLGLLMVKLKNFNMDLQYQICGGLHQVFGLHKNAESIQASTKKVCTTCHGSGELENGDDCPICGGDGCIYEDKLTEDDYIQDIKN